MDRPKLKDSKNKKYIEPFRLNEIPDDIITRIGGHLVHLVSVGRTGISGDDWGDALASAVDGVHLSSPLGIADVILGGMAWSTKTIEHASVFNAGTLRLISGRCSPDYSYGITDPHVDIQKTGSAVLNIYNERVSIAQENYSSIRTSVLVRSPDMLSYALFEEESHRFITANYSWDVNKNGNLRGFDKVSGKQMFTWQPHGSQFTIHADMPHSAKKFAIKKPPIISKAETLKAIGFDASWVTIIK
jgi:hypothetical protein